MKNFVKRSFVGKSLNGKIAASIIAIVWIMMLVFMGLFCYILWDDNGAFNKGYKPAHISCCRRGR